MGRNGFIVNTVSGEVTVTTEDIDDIMISALEGGICYWCNEAEVEGQYLGQYASEQIGRGGSLRLYDMESDEVYLLTIGRFLDGLRKWINDGRDLYGAVTESKAIDPAMIDGEMADLIIQYALFGEVIYG